MKTLTIVLAALLVLVQYPMWLGKGGWVRAWDLDRQLGQQQQANSRLSQRNAALDGEVRDLRKGLHAVEERARYELGMVRRDEIFVQFSQVDGPAVDARGAAASGAATAAATQNRR